MPVNTADEFEHEVESNIRQSIKKYITIAAIAALIGIIITYFITPIEDIAYSATVPGGHNSAVVYRLLDSSETFICHSCTAKVTETTVTDEFITLDIELTTKNNYGLPDSSNFDFYITNNAYSTLLNYNYEVISAEPSDNNRMVTYKVIMTSYIPVDTYTDGAFSLVINIPDSEEKAEFVINRQVDI